MSHGAFVWKERPYQLHKVIDKKNTQLENELIELGSNTNVWVAFFIEGTVESIKWNRIQERIPGLGNWKREDTLSKKMLEAYSSLEM